MRTFLGVLVGLVLAGASVVFFGWLLWWLWTRRDEGTRQVAIEIDAEPRPREIQPSAIEAAGERATPLTAAEVEPETAEEPEPEDLKRVEGIGPKISSVLNDAGIVSFEQLANVELDRLKQILEDADPRLLRLADPTTWPEQAALAAAGEWEALEALQGELRGGRRR